MRERLIVKFFQGQDMKSKFPKPKLSEYLKNDPIEIADLSIQKFYLK